MQNLNNVVHSLDTQIISNEEYHRVKDLLEHLNNLSDPLIEVEDSILTPYYVFQGRRMELYEYELRISTNAEQNFEEYVMIATGKKNINEVPFDVLQLKKKCYIESEEYTHTVNIKRLNEYLEFLLFNDNIEAQLKEYLGYFDNENLFFEIY